MPYSTSLIVKAIYGANLDTSMLEHFYQIWAKIFGAVLGTPWLGLFGVYGHVNVNRPPCNTLSTLQHQKPNWEIVHTIQLFLCMWSLHII